MFSSYKFSVADFGSQLKAVPCECVGTETKSFDELIRMANTMPTIGSNLRQQIEFVVSKDCQEQTRLRVLTSDPHNSELRFTICAQTLAKPVTTHAWQA
tara:strand:+ start:65350 stop:65646 length:297 start_codon:yes stop_codon:yes gene_type:complete